MMQTTAVVIGTGHAGLAMSRRLTARSIDHVVPGRVTGSVFIGPAVPFAAPAGPPFPGSLPRAH